MRQRFLPAAVALIPCISILYLQFPLHDYGYYSFFSPTPSDYPPLAARSRKSSDDFGYIQSPVSEQASRGSHKA